jgi:hypothetical protein
MHNPFLRMELIMTRDPISIGQVKIWPTNQRYWLLILLGGLLIGLTASLPLAVVWPYPKPLPESICVYGGEKIRLGSLTLPFHCMVTFMFIQPLVWCSFLVSGALFGLLAQILVGSGSRIRVAAVGGGTFLVAAFVGGQVVDILPNPDTHFFVSGVAPPFAIMSFIVSFTFVLAIGLVLSIRGLAWRAIVVAVATALSYFLTAWFLYGFNFAALGPGHEPLAGLLHETWRPMGPMMKTILISNFVAGTIGGSTLLFLFGIPSRTA